MRDWEASRVPVYLDFGDDNLWRMNPHNPNGRAHLLATTKVSFLKAHREGLLNEEQMTEGIERVVAEYFDLLRRPSQARPLVGFERHMAGRRRFRL